ncbi:NCS2 family permease [Agarilytica rhodophyticola]|uniref:NCS2 family permease n=1 Tax=Agarilytica rhodophyticola TaxID=1737490 RepID=UPI000B3460D8|nr:NCS2 family permease [Agarilytica rhodophyticola]
MNTSKSNITVEFVAALSTYLTMSYIFLLNPILLAKIDGVSITAVFGATVLTAVFSTLVMGLWAKAPFAAAPVPSITTFFVGYVVLTLGLTFEQALAAVLLSGALSLIMTTFSIKGKIVDSVSPLVSYGVLAALCGFLLAVGLKQANLIQYQNGLFSALTLNTEGLVILGAGLFVSVLFNNQNIPGPLIGLLAASIIAFLYGHRGVSEAEFSTELFSYVGAIEFSAIAKVVSSIDFFIAVIVFFVIDFFAGVGKYIGLFQALKSDKTDGSELFNDEESKTKLSRSLYSDGLGNIFGSVFGAGSVAVFVSSAVGVKAGGRTGLTAVFIAVLMAISIAFIPLVGIIPTIAISGILVYIGFILLPIRRIRSEIDARAIGWIEVSLCVVAAMLSLFTFSLDLAIALVFSLNSILLLITSGDTIGKHALFHLSSVILAFAVGYKYVV